VQPWSTARCHGGSRCRVRDGSPGVATPSIGPKALDPKKTQDNPHICCRSEMSRIASSGARHVS
jgi:hypothetical protein